MVASSLQPPPQANNLAQPKIAISRTRRPKHARFLRFFRSSRRKDWMAIDNWLLLDREEFSWLRKIEYWYQFSPLLCVVSFMFFILRRLSLSEYLRAIYRTFVPSRHIPAWFADLYIATWFVLILVALWNADRFQHVGWTYFALFVVIQMVQVNFYNNIWRVVVKKQRLAYSHGRNLIIGFVQRLVVFHAMVSTVLITVIIGQAIGAVGSLREHNPRKMREK